jgi:hypothetical protein
VLLLGFPTDGEPGTARIEADDQPYDPAIFNTLPQRVSELLDQHARNNPLHSAIARSDSRRLGLVNRLRQQAVNEALQRSEASAVWTFFASHAVLVDDLNTHVCIGVDTAHIVDIPSFSVAGTDPSNATVLSLVHALMEEFLTRIEIALGSPIHGDIINPIRSPIHEIIRAAVARFVCGLLRRIGGWHNPQVDALLNAISALPYEGRVGQGTLLLAQANTSAVEVELQLSTAISLDDKRIVRKLLETTSVAVGLLVDQEGKVYGIGRYIADQEPSALQVVFVARGAWDLLYAGGTLLSVRDGDARLPAPALDVVRLSDLIDRLIPHADTNRLLELARAAARHNHDCHPSRSLSNRPSYPPIS